MKLPKFVSSDAFGLGFQTEGCFAACITMLIMYWSVKLKKPYWIVPKDVNSADWTGLGKELLKEKIIAGQETCVAPEKGVLDLLRSRRISKDLGYEAQNVEDLIGTCVELTKKEIPPIFYFDDHKLKTGRESGGRIHSSIFMEKMGTTIRYVDPASLGTRGYQLMDLDQLLDAVSDIPLQVRYLYPKKEITIRTYTKKESLDKWLTLEGGS